MVSAERGTIAMQKEPMVMSRALCVISSPFPASNPIVKVRWARPPAPAKTETSAICKPGVVTGREEKEREKNDTCGMG